MTRPKRSGPFLFAAGVLLLLTAALLMTARASASKKRPKKDSGVQAVVDSVSAARLENTVRALAAIPTRHTLSETGSARAVAWIAGQFEEISKNNGGRLQVERETWTQPAGERLLTPVRLTNVVATLPGDAAPERIIIVSGHYDSRVSDVMNATADAPGANDDASGVAVALELARVMAGRHYAATIKFVAVTGEEQGLYGSTHLADEMTNGGQNILAMITNDIVGNSRGQGGIHDALHVRVFAAGSDPTQTPAQAARSRAAGTDADSPARTLARAILDADRQYVRGFDTVIVYRLDRYLRGGDHQPFVQRGFAAVRFTEPNEDWRHQHQDVRQENNVQYGDLPQFMDYAYLANVARVNAAAVASLASAPAPPQNVQLKADLSPVTTLTWNPVSEATAYEVLWRLTNAPDWQGSRRVENSQTVTLPLSKDDYVFAVRSVSADGARGLPAIPSAGR